MTEAELHNLTLLLDRLEAELVQRGASLSMRRVSGRVVAAIDWIRNDR